MPSTRRTTEHVRTHVLDTSVLLSDPRAPLRFAEHEVVIPIVVVVELEARRSHPELGYFAREALRLLDDLRVVHGRLDEPIPVGSSGGTLRIELGHTDSSLLPSGFQMGDNDSRILAVTSNLAARGADVILVSKDLPLRVKASAVGIPAQEYLAELALSAGLEAVLECRQHRKVVVFRTLFAVGGQELGYLPGTENEKMNPWGQAVFDTLGAVTTTEVVEEIVARGMLEVLPLTHIRGRSLHDCFVIVDEAQSLERNVLLTVLAHRARQQGRPHPRCRTAGEPAGRSS